MENIYEKRIEGFGGVFISENKIENTIIIEFSIDGFVFKRSGGNLIRFSKKFNECLTCLKCNGYKYIKTVGVNVSNIPIIEIKDVNGFIGNINMNHYSNYIKTNKKVKSLCLKNGHTLMSFCRDVESKIVIDFNCGHKHQDIVVNYYFRNSKCRICNNIITEVECNDVATTHPNIIAYLVDKNDGYKYTSRNWANVMTRCPCCNYESYKPIAELCRGKFTCPICSDNLSMGEKLMYTILFNFNINFEMHKTFKWSNRKEYDFYLKDINSIIEVHGVQHYGNGFESVGGKTLEEEQENDKFKEQLAKDNGIEHYIVIDARKSSLDFIKENIVNSCLFEILNIQEIQWDYIYNTVTDSLMEKVWNAKSENQDMTTTEIANLFNLKSPTIREWLKIGDALSKCKYDPHKESCDRINRNAEDNSRIVLMYKNDCFIGEYKSATYLEKNSKELIGDFLYASEIRRVCNGIKKTYKGYFFKYKYTYDYKQSTNIKTSKPIELYKDGELIKRYTSCQELSRKSLNDVGVKLQAGKICEVANGKRKQHKGFTAKYIEYNPLKQDTRK